jgi:hypothetical protein
VGTAYNQLSAVVQQRLQADGLTVRAAKDLALIVTALLEGGSLLSQAQQNSSAFRLSVKQASALCKTARAD